MSVIFEAKCDKCGQDLTVSSLTLDRDGDLCIEVAPCEDCLAEAKQEGKDAA